MLFLLCQQEWSPIIFPAILRLGRSDCESSKSQRSCFSMVFPKLFVPLPDWGHTCAARAYDIGEDGTSSSLNSLLLLELRLPTVVISVSKTALVACTEEFIKKPGVRSTILCASWKRTHTVRQNQPTYRKYFLRSVKPPRMVHQCVGWCPASSSLQIIISGTAILDVRKVYAHACLPLEDSRLLLWGLRDWSSDRATRIWSERAGCLVAS